MRRKGGKWRMSISKPRAEFLLPFHLCLALSFDGDFSMDSVVLPFLATGNNRRESQDKGNLPKLGQGIWDGVVGTVTVTVLVGEEGWRSTTITGISKSSKCSI